MLGPRFKVKRLSRQISKLAAKAQHRYPTQKMSAHNFIFACSYGVAHKHVTCVVSNLQHGNCKLFPQQYDLKRLKGQSSALGEDKCLPMELSFPPFPKGQSANSIGGAELQFYIPCFVCAE